MGSAFERTLKKNSGQGIIELTLTLGLIMLCVFLSLQSSSLVKKLFKHDYVAKESNRPLYDLKFSRDVLVFSDLKASKNFKKMTSLGWKADPLFKNLHGLVFLKKEEEKAFIFNQLGVIYE